MNHRDYTVVSVFTRIPPEEYYCVPSFFKSIKGEQNILLLNNSCGVEWSGLGSKPKMLYKAIKDGAIKTKYIIFCDSHDLVFTMPPAYTMMAYEQYNSPLVISAERNCFPQDTKEYYDSIESTSSFKYLNSGMIVGETGALLTVLEAMDLKNIPEDYRNEDGSMTHINDQLLFQQIFTKQPVPMKLDYNQSLCLTLHSLTVDDLILDQRGFVSNTETKVIATAAHGNGSGKTNGCLEAILKHLNLL